MRVAPSEMSDFESLLRKTGWGLYHKFLMCIACACAISECGAMISLSFAIPIALCDLSIPEKYLQYFYVTFMCGMALGGNLLSSLADLIGRKALLHLSLVLMFVSLLGCAFSHEWIMLIICLFILGSGLASNSNIIRIILSECLTIERRANMLIVVDLAGSLGYVIFTAINWLLTPFAADFNKRGFRFCTFRIMFALPALPTVIVACASALVLPSPRFLLLREKYDAAIRVLQQMYTANKNRLQEELQVQGVQSYINDYGVNIYPEPHNCSEQIIYTIKKLVKSINILRRENFLRILVALMSLNVMISLGTLIMNLWLARVLNDNGNDCILQGIDLPYFENITTNSCKFNNGLSIYFNFFVISFSVIIGKLFLLIATKFLQRRFLILLLYVFCGASCYLIIVFKTSKSIEYVIASITLILYSGIETILTICVIESFPTAIRGLVMGYVRCFPYLTRGILLYWLKSSCDFVPVIVGMMMLIGSFFGCFLQERRGLPMVE